MITKREGLMLYWCEGSKDKYSVYVNNSDPKILILFIEWLKKYYNIDKNNIKLYLHLWEEKIPQEKIIKKQWSKILGVKNNQFYKSHFKPTKKIKGKDKFPMGICRVRINNKNLAYNIKEDIKKEFEIKL